MAFLDSRSDGFGVLGRDVWPVGRLVRLLGGVWFVQTGLSTARDWGVGAGQAVEVGAYVLAIALLYTGLLWVLGERVLARLNAWTASALMFVPVLLIAGGSMVGIPVPQSLTIGLAFYIGLSLLLLSAIGYGGCEIIGVPVAILRRRYTLYCSANGVDAVERALTSAHRHATRLAAGILALLAAIYYFFLHELFGLLGIVVPFDTRWGALLLLPAVVVLARETWIAYRESRELTAQTRSYGLGALALLTMILVIAVTGEVLLFVVGFFVMIFVNGLIAAIAQGIAVASRRTAGQTDRQ